MTTNKKVTGTAVSIPMGVGAGVLISLLLTLALVAFEAWLVLTGRVEAVLTGYLSMAVLALSSFLGSVCSVLRTKRRSILVGLLSGALYCVVLLLSTALFFGGNYLGVPAAVIVAMLSSGVAGLVGMRGRDKSARRYNRYRSC